MRDRNGVFFEVGAELQSTQSKGDAGIVKCVDINNIYCTLQFSTPTLPLEDFRINQPSLDTSLWEVRR